MSEKRKPQPASGDYANFATTIVLGQLVSLLALDEPLVKQVAILLQQGLATSNTRDGGGHEGWQFGIMNGIARLLKSLYEAVTLSDQSWALREELLDLLIASLHPSYQISVLGSLGAGLGLGELSQIFKSIQSVVYPTAVQLINNEIGNEQKSNKMAGAAWVVAMSTTKSDRATQLELLNKLQSTMLLNQEHWTEGWPAVQVAHAYLLHLHLQTSGQQSAILSEYHAYINGQLEVIESSNTPSAYRQMAVMNLAVALGLNWSVSTKEGIVPFYFVDASTEAIHRLWKACLPSPTINMRDVKSNRMVGLIIVRWANELQMGQDVFMKGIGGTGTDKSSNEPRDLSRLPSTSYLRVLFDILAEMVQGKFITQHNHYYLYINTSNNRWI
ncbi:hypothetical protein BDF19DRAFT_438015 [Syncephalis fuscata]|nr:hypothetical protein BDF19DRAFT_438015 [Syncephalis fuscata]